MSRGGLTDCLRKICGLFLVVAVTAAMPRTAPAYETDQLTNRARPVEDSTAVLDREVNRVIAEIVDEWGGRPRDEMRFVNQVYGKIGGIHWVDKIERWAMKSPEVDRLDTKRFDSVFSGQPIWALRVTAIFGVGATIRVNDQLIGTDKLGHFISQGRKFYRRFLHYGSEARAGKQSVFTEQALFGQVSNGIFSNADLVANYEGHRFYRSLFEDDIVGGKPSILRWSDNGWVIQRKFTWADHVNEYWDEALNVNHFDAGLYRHMHDRFLSYCPEYWKHPSLYTIENEERLKRRYSHIGLRDTSELRLDSLCPVQAFLQDNARQE